MSALRLVFLGSDPIALPFLNWLVGDGRAVADVVAVFTQPDRATGRGQKIQPNAIKEWALARTLPVFQPERLTPDIRDRLAALGPDVALVMAYGHILRDDFINVPTRGTLNLHTSLLPKYRGASPIQAAVASGDRETGVTLMRIVRALDAGPIADVERVPIGPLDTASEVERKLADACVPLVARALPRLADDALEFTNQDDRAATYCRKLTKEDGAVDFSVSARELAARINGLYPWPGCAIEVNSIAIKIGLADAVDDVATTITEPGTVIGTDECGLLVQTGVGVLRLRRLQRAGGKMLPAPEFLRGIPIVTGTRVPSRPLTELVTRR